MENGFDNVKYLRDITETELREINIQDDRDIKRVCALYVYVQVSAFDKPNWCSFGPI